ncbi:unnamed protein product [Arabidopsis halleri]
MCSKRSTNALIFFFLLLVCRFSEIGGIDTTRRSVVEKPIRELGDSSLEEELINEVGPSCTCAARGGLQRLHPSGACSRPRLRPCPPPRAH